MTFAQANSGIDDLVSATLAGMPSYPDYSTDNFLDLLGLNNTNAFAPNSLMINNNPLGSDAAFGMNNTANGFSNGVATNGFSNGFGTSSDSDGLGSAGFHFIAAPQQAVGHPEAQYLQQQSAVGAAVAAAQNNVTGRTDAQLLNEELDADPQVQALVHTISADHKQLIDESIIFALENVGGEKQLKQKSQSNPKYYFTIERGLGNEYFATRLGKARERWVEIKQKAHASAAMTAINSADATMTALGLGSLQGGFAGNWNPAATNGSKNNDSTKGTSATSPTAAQKTARKYPEPAFKQRSDVTTEVSDEWQRIFLHLEKAASMDYIKSGRMLVENEVDAGNTENFLGYVYRLMSVNDVNAKQTNPASATSFQGRLHILYAIHDLLQHEAVNRTNKGQTERIPTVKPYLPWLLRTTYRIASKPEEQKKVTNLLKLWLDRKVITKDEMEDFELITTTRDQLPSTNNPSSSPTTTSIPASTGASTNATTNLGAPQAAQTNFGAPQTNFGASTTSNFGAPTTSNFGAPQTNLGAPTSTSSNFGLPTTANTNQLPVQQPGQPQTPETIPVGLMATMLKQASQRNRSWQTAFYPYKPLDPKMTPDAPPIQPLTERQQQRLDNFLDNWKRRRRNQDSDESSDSESSSSSSSPSPSPVKMKVFTTKPS